MKIQKKKKVLIFDKINISLDEILEVQYTYWDGSN